MVTRTISVPTSNATLYSLMSDVPQHCNAIGIEAPSANTGITYYGEEGHVVGPLIPGAKETLPAKSTKNISIRGTSGDTVIVVIDQG